MRAVKKIIKWFLRSKNLSINPINPYQESLEPVRHNWLQKYLIDVVIDVGASTGGFARKARAIFPSAKIFSFEPLQDSFDKLNEAFKGDERFKSFNMVLSKEKGEVSFERNARSGSSSLLEVTELHKEAYPETRDSQKIVVKSDRLDDVFDREAIGGGILLKLDVQGGESLVLEGAGDFLQKVSVIFCEVSFNECYKGQMLFNDMVEYMSKKGFRVEGIENVSQSIKDGTFLQCDVYFVNVSKK